MASESEQDFYRNLRWWGFYIFAQVTCHVVLTSIAAFFHFLLDHELSLVEGWVHNNGWELAVVAKVFAVGVVHRLLRVRLYRPRGVRDFLRDQWHLPDPRTIVVSVFLCLIFLFVSGPEVQSQNSPYFSYHVVAFLGMALWLMLDYFCLAILQDLFPITEHRRERWRFAFYLAGFWLAFRLVVPDYFGTSLVMHLHFLALLVVSGPRFQHWGDVAAYLLIFAAPMGALFGVDPIWGADFSPFKFGLLPSAPFLLVIWMLSLAYYCYRHRLSWPFST
jgi:hypothetical protein